MPTFIVPVETWVPTEGRFKGHTGHRPKYHAEIGYGFETHHGLPPDKSFWLIDVKGTDAQLKELRSKPDVTEILDDAPAPERVKVRAIPLERAANGREFIESVRESVSLKQRGLNDAQIEDIYTRRKQARIDGAVKDALRAGN